jgi:hypothetical protein
MKGLDGVSLFGAIEQTVVIAGRSEPARR